jgi:16S rRNA processing protein RimM
MSAKNSVYSDSDQNNTGSSNIDEPVYLTIGQLGRAHGVNGEILIRLTTDFPERIQKGKNVFLGDDHAQYRIENVRQRPKGLILKFANIDTIEDVEKLSKKEVFVTSDSLPELPEGEYYHHQMLGIRAVTEDGQDLGVLTEILETGANDVYVITDENGKEELIPALRQNLVNIDIRNRIMVVKVLKYFNQD